MDLSHIGQDGRAKMVDVSDKSPTLRTAKAKGKIVMSRAALSAVWEGNGKKGEVLNTATVAGILAAKKTWEVIPMCHNIALSGVEVFYEFMSDGIEITAEVNTIGATGAEMEALHAVAVSALTIYDMVKSMDKTMTIDNLRLVKKTGGKSGEVNHE